MILLFAGQDYYPRGGADDLRAGVLGLEEARAFLEASVPRPETLDWDWEMYTWAHAYDTERQEIVGRWYRDTLGIGTPWLTEEEYAAYQVARHKRSREQFDALVAAGQPFYNDPLKRWHYVIVDGYPEIRTGPIPEVGE